MGTRSSIEDFGYAEIHRLSSEYQQIINRFQKRYPRVTDQLASKLYIRKVCEEIKNDKEFRAWKYKLYSVIDQFIKENPGKLVEFLNYCISIFKLNFFQNNEIKQCLDVGIFTKTSLINSIGDSARASDRYIYFVEDDFGFVFSVVEYEKLKDVQES